MGKESAMKRPTPGHTAGGDPGDREAIAATAAAPGGEETTENSDCTEADLHKLPKYMEMSGGLACLHVVWPHPGPH